MRNFFSNFDFFGMLDFASDIQSDYIYARDEDGRFIADMNHVPIFQTQKSVTDITLVAESSSDTTLYMIAPAVFELSSLLAANGGDGSAGFVINGIDPSDSIDGPVSNAGDINGDGFDDFLIGANGGDPNGLSSGESYVIFGRNDNTTPFAASLELSSLDGTNGFVINGIDGGDASGEHVSAAGDINGDGFDDILIGARGANPNGTRSGETYVILGRDDSTTAFAATLELSALDGTNGFVINGIDAYDDSSFSVSTAGDINGDGFDDILIGTRLASPNGNRSGEGYVVFGRDDSTTAFAATLELSALDGTNGFVINGIDAFDDSSRSISTAGDINGDGFDDILIGATGGDPNGSSSGETYVIFGRDDSTTAFAASLELSTLDGTNGFVINGIDAFDQIGFSVSTAGDINGDGFDDILIGARSASPNGSSSGESYVVFGRDNSTIAFAATLELSSLDGTNGFVINGVGAGDESGYSVSSAGDINGDGFDDILIGALRGGPNGNESGESYVVFGRDTSVADFTATLDLSTLNGTNGFSINGIDQGDTSGRSVSAAGDINGDGFDDIIIGASGADPNGTNSGESYIIFGSVDFGPQYPTPEDDTIVGTTGDDIIDLLAGNDTYQGLAGNDTVIGGAGDDSLNGGEGDDVLSGGSNDDTLNGGIGNDTLNGDGGTDIINGGDGNDTLNGGALIDTITAGDGDDVILITGINQADVVDGGAGIDTLDISGVTFSGPWEINLLNETYTDNFDILSIVDVENVFGSVYDDLITGDAQANLLRGNDGEDLINGGAGRDRLEGGAGQDILRGGADTDFMLGGAGRDRMFGGDQSDRMFGGDGNDIMLGQGSNDIMFGGGNIDTLYGGLGNDILNGGSNVDRLFGEENNDTLYGGNAPDLIDGGAGNDILYGGNRTSNDGSGDTFIFALNFGTDVIMDFEDGLDVIDFSGHTGINDFNDVLARASEDGTSLLIATNANNTLIIENFSLAELDASDFVF